MSIIEWNMHLVCPWCGKGEVLADHTAKVVISVKCPKCGKVYRADLYKMITEKGTATRRL